MVNLPLQFSHIFHREVTCVSRRISASNTRDPDGPMNHERGLEEFFLGFFYSKQVTVSLNSVVKQRDDEEQTGLSKTPPSRSHLFAGTTGNLEHFTQDLTCLRDDCGRHDDTVLDEWRLEMKVEVMNEKRW